MAFLVLLLLVATSSTAFSTPTSDTLHAHSSCPGPLTHTEHPTPMLGSTFGPLCGPASPRTRSRRPVYRHGLAWLLSWFQPHGGGSGSNRSTANPCPSWDCPSQASAVPTLLYTSQPSDHGETLDRGQPLTPVPHSPGPPPTEPRVSGPKPHVDAGRVILCLWPSAPLPVPGQLAGRGCYTLDEEDILPVLTRAIPYLGPGSLGPGSLPDSQPQPPPRREERVPPVQPALQPASQTGAQDTDRKQKPGPKGRPVPDADWKHPRPPAQARLDIPLLWPEQSCRWWSKEVTAGFGKGRHSNVTISVPGTLESVVLLLMGYWAEAPAGPWAGATFHLPSWFHNTCGVIFVLRVILGRRKVPAEQESRVVAGREGRGHIPSEPLALRMEESLAELQRLLERNYELEWEVEALQQQEWWCKQEAEVNEIKRALEGLLHEVF
ncbi:uncharacterized protein [Vicugna pacos]|uniref:Uncharacterized protein n=1 Tax=Vicugna pacos TaxID=30538 RepID=A0ABM5E2A2_VICPA